LTDSRDSMSIILFSGELDRAMAALTLANGAAGQGMRVSVFFTFWGLSLLRAKRGEAKTFLEGLFKTMLPVGASATTSLSRFNFGGLGGSLLRRMLRSKEAQTPEDLLKMAMERQITFVACEASLKILGLTADELIPYDQLHVAGVDSFLESARQSKIQLFI